MHTVRVITDIAAPIERCFDLARDVNVHLKSAVHTGERVVDGKRSGLLELGDTITFEARHLGVTQRLTAAITAFDRPRFFQDRAVRSVFRFLEHDHSFESLPRGVTRMIDDLRFRVPLGIFGWPIGEWVVGAHLRRFLISRGQSIRQMAETR